MKRSGLILILLLAAVILGVPSATAAAAGKSADQAPETSAWVSASPDPAPAGSRVDLTGCGFEFKPAHLHITHPGGYVEVLAVGMWNTGCFSTYFRPGQAGAYKIDVYQAQRNPRKPMVLKASTTLSVQ